jgi:hypothetical protein
VELDRLNINLPKSLLQSRALLKCCATVMNIIDSAIGNQPCRRNPLGSAGHLSESARLPPGAFIASFPFSAYPTNLYPETAASLRIFLLQKKYLTTELNTSCGLATPGSCSLIDVV